MDGVEYAIKIQEDLKKQNDELPESRRMEFRIGVNLGDVVEDGGRIHGEGVNIAARLESLAEPGEVCISGFVYDQVKNRLELDNKYIGKKKVKNIREPIFVYRVFSSPMAAKYIEPASEERMAFPLPNKPSIAVLPVTNMSSDPEQDYMGALSITSKLIKIQLIIEFGRNVAISGKIIIKIMHINMATANGIIPLYIVYIEISGIIPASMNTIIPTGGKIIPIC